MAVYTENDKCLHTHDKTCKPKTPQFGVDVEGCEFGPFKTKAEAVKFDKAVRAAYRKAEDLMKKARISFLSFAEFEGVALDQADLRGIWADAADTIADRLANRR